MFRTILVASLFVGGVASPATANNKELTRKGANPGQIVCKVDRFIGSNVKNRVCKTRAEWAAVAEDTKQGLDDRWYKDRGGPPKDSQFRPTPGVSAPSGAAGASRGQ